MTTSRLTTFAFLFLGSASLTGHASAQLLTTVTEWNFNNNAVAVNTSPTPSTGAGTSSTVGMNIDSATGTVDGTTTDTSDVNTSTPLSTDPGTPNQQWRIRGGNGTTSPGTNPTGTNAWTSLAPIGSQGAQFVASTAGFNKIQVSFDWSPTGQGEGKLQLQYTLNGSTYINVPVSLFTSFGTGATATGMTNTASGSANTVVGGYLVSGSTTTYMNGITANLSSIAGAANDANFGIRLLNAATGADDTTTTGAALNNTSGNWRFDEVTISGAAIAAPEPGTFVLAGLGLVGLLPMLRRRKTV